MESLLVSREFCFVSLLLAEFASLEWSTRPKFQGK